MYGYIYITTNLIDGKKYIGQKKSDIFLTTYKGSGTYLWNAIKKYGWENFETELIEFCETREQLNEREIFWIAYYDSANPNKRDLFYNVSPGGNGGNNFYGRTPQQMEETKNKIRKSRTGKIATLETKRKMSLNNAVRNPEVLARIIKSNTGKRHTDETKRKMSEASKGIPKSKESIEKLKKTLAVKNGNEFYGKSITVYKDDIFYKNYNTVYDFIDDFGSSTTDGIKCLLNGWIPKHGRFKGFRASYN